MTPAQIAVARGSGPHDEAYFTSLEATHPWVPDGDGRDDRASRDEHMSPERQFLHAKMRAAYPAMFEDDRTPRLRSAAYAEPPADIDDEIVAGLVRPRTIAVVASAEGVGKTQASLELTIRVATNSGPLFGYYGIPSARVVAYIDEENGEAEMYRREESVIAALNQQREQPLTRDDLACYYRVSFAGLHLGQPAGQRWLRDQLREMTRESGFSPELIVLDTGGAMVDDEWGAALKDAIRFLRQIIREIGCAFVILVHLTKPPKDRQARGAGEHGGALSDVMGQWSRHADVVVTMSDLGAGRVRLAVRKRMTPSSVVMARRHGLWDVVAVTEDATEDRLDDRVLGAIAAGADTADIVRIGLGQDGKPLPRRTFYDALRRLRLQGFVEDGTPLRLTTAGQDAVA